MSAPKPDKIEHLVKAIARELEQLETLAIDINAKSKTVLIDYGYVYPSGYTRGGSPSSEGSRQHHSIHSDISDMFNDDPEIVATKVRKKLVSAARYYLESYKDLQRAESALKAALRIMAGPEPTVPERDDHEFERTATKGDLARAREAQLKREGRARDRETPWAGEEVHG